MSLVALPYGLMEEKLNTADVSSTYDE